MDLEILSRIQFALTIAFHYIFPPLSIGLSLCIVIMEGLYLKTKNRTYEELTKFWVKIFALTFALGVATGTVMVFAFGNNWANFSRFVGDVFGSVLGAEGVFAFFLEAGFLSILLFGWDKVKPRTHFISTILVSIGSHFSAVWIVIANSWMQTPAGFEIVGEGIRAHAVITDITQMLFNPSAIVRLWHVIVGCWLAGAFLVMSVSAFYIWKKRTVSHAIIGLKIGTVVATIAAILQFFAGDSSAKLLVETQPAKLAAIEGIFETQASAPLSIIGYVNNDGTKHALEIPGLLSLLTYGNLTGEIKGLNSFPKEDRPNSAIVFQTYHIMVGMWGFIVLACLVSLWAWKKKWEVGKWPYLFLVISVLFPQIANQTGWFTAEIGRQPWVVYGVLRTADALSPSVSAGQVLGSIIMFAVIYSLLFILFIYLLNHKIQAGIMGGKDLEPVFGRSQAAIEKFEEDKK
jgi:cytochrome d ubiquinol oxidase subunit I